MGWGLVDIKLGRETASWKNGKLAGDVDPTFRFKVRVLQKIFLNLKSGAGWMVC